MHPGPRAEGAYSAPRHLAGFWEGEKGMEEKRDEEKEGGHGTRASVRN